MTPQSPAGRPPRCGRTGPPWAARYRHPWYAPASHAAALDGVDRVYLVPPVGDADPAATMLPFLRQARAAGVRRAVLLSSSAIPEGGPAVGTVHQALPALFEQWAVLRPSWFMQNFTGTHAHARSIRDEGVAPSPTARRTAPPTPSTTSPAGRRAPSEPWSPVATAW